MRTKQRRQVIHPGPGDSGPADSGELDRLRTRAQRLLEAGRRAISGSLSEDSQEFLSANQQAGGQ